MNLLFRAILLAFTSHLLHASDEDFRLHPGVPDFDGENVRAAIPVLDLGRTEQIAGDFQPKEVLNLRGACMLEEIPADLAQICKRHFVNQIGSNGPSPLFLLALLHPVSRSEEGVHDRVDPHHDKRAEDQKKIGLIQDLKP